MLDDKYRDYYSLRAGLHCQSVVADRTSRALKDSSFSVYTLAPLYGGTEGTPLGVLGLEASLRTPSFCHHNFNVWQNSQ